MFFMVPIGHEDSRVNRFPVMTVAIVVLCLIGFGATWPECQKEEEAMWRTFSSLYARAAALSDSTSRRHRDDDEDEGDSAMAEAMAARTPQEFLEKIDELARRAERSDADEDEVARLHEEISAARKLLDDRVFHAWGLVPADVRPHAFLTHMFLHAGYLHLIFNLLFLMVVGPALENFWGRLVFPAAYVASGLAAAIGFMAMSGPIPIPMVGASGAIAGLMGAFLVAFTRTRIKMACLFLIPFPRLVTFFTPAWVFLPFWAGWEIVQGLKQLGMGGATGGVAHWAHVSGFLFGAAVPFFLKRTGLDRRFFPAYVTVGGKQKVAFDDPSLLWQKDHRYRTGLRQRQDCEWSESAETFLALAAAYPDSVGPRLELAETYQLDGEPKKRREVLLEALELAARVKDPKLLDIFEAVRLDGPSSKLSGDCLFRVGTALAQVERHVDALEVLRRFLALYPEHPQRARASTKLAEVLAGPLGDPQAAQAILSPAAPAPPSPRMTQPPPPRPPRTPVR